MYITVLLLHDKKREPPLVPPLYRNRYIYSQFRVYLYLSSIVFTHDWNGCVEF